MIDSVKDLQFEDVLSVYSGRDGACCCGCSGTHSYNSLYKDLGSKTRGYPVTDRELNDRQVRRVLNIIKKAEKVEDDRVCISTVVGKRLYIVYLKDPK
jgi:hypothetical protein